MSGISNHYDSMVSIASVIESLNLPGFGPPIIQEVGNYKADEVTPPCVLIAPSSPEEVEDALNDQDGIGYGIGVAIVIPAGLDDIATTLEQRLAIRQKIRRRMNNRQLDGNGGSILVPMNYNLSCHPMSPVDVSAWIKDQKSVSAMIVRSWCQEPRS